MNRRQQEILQRHSHTLTTKLTVDEEFISRCETMSLITHGMRTSIMAGGSHSEKASKLLEYVHRGGPDAFRIFVLVLQETGRDWLACKLNDTEAIANAEGAMSPERKARLQQFRQEIMIIPLDTIWDQVDHIFSSAEELQIKTQTSNERKMATLLDILSSKSDLAFDHLVRAIRTRHTELADRLVHGVHEEERSREIREIDNRSIPDTKMKN